MDLPMTLDRRMAAIEAGLADVRRDLEVRFLALQVDLTRELLAYQVFVLRWMLIYWVATEIALLLTR